MTMHKQHAFTLIELMVVMVVISILASMSVFGYNIIQKDARDSARSSKTTVIAEALERYYRTNNEYPAVLALAGQSLTTVKQKLEITDADVLTFPVATAGTNSIVSTTPTIAQLQYEGSGGSNCRTLSTGYCDAFRLTYTKEADGLTVSTVGRQATFVP